MTPRAVMGFKSVRGHVLVYYPSRMPDTSPPVILATAISPDKARKGVIYPLKTGIYALVGVSKRTFTR